MAVLYEVTLRIDPDVEEAYLAWLHDHVDEMPAFSFIADVRNTALPIAARGESFSREPANFPGCCDTIVVSSGTKQGLLQETR
jgi:hypothetical protein